MNLYTHNLSQFFSSNTYAIRLLKVIREKELHVEELICDKIFCSVWIDQGRIVTGAKDNKVWWLILGLFFGLG